MIGFGASDHDRHPALPDMPLRDFFEKVYRPRKIPGARPNTTRLYDITFRRLEKYLGRVPMVSDLREDLLIEFLEDAVKGHSGRTANAYRDRLLAQARFAVQKGRLALAPDLPTWPEPRRLPRAYRLAEVQRLLEACAMTPGWIYGIPARRYWLAVALLLYDTGVRSGVLWTLRRADVDLDQRTIFLRAEYQKQRSDQLLRFAPDTLAAVQAIWHYEREADDLLFPWDRSPCRRYAHWREILQRAGLPTKREDMFHRLRKTTATICRRYGVDATTQLGHSSDAVTRRHYLDPTDELQAADVMPRPLGFGAALPAAPGPKLIEAEVVDAGDVGRSPRLVEDRTPPKRPITMTQILVTATAPPPRIPADIPPPPLDTLGDDSARSRKLRELIRQGARLVVRGMGLREASRALGKKCECALAKARRRHPDLWAAAIYEAKQTESNGNERTEHER